MKGLLKDLQDSIDGLATECKKNKNKVVIC